MVSITERERNRILLERDLSAFREIMRGAGMETATPGLVEMTFHKTVTQADALPMDMRVASWWWLHERGLKTMDDGDVTAAAMKGVSGGGDDGLADAVRKARAGKP